MKGQQARDVPAIRRAAAQRLNWDEDDRRLAKLLDVLAANETLQEYRAGHLGEEEFWQRLKETAHVLEWRPGRADRDHPARVETLTLSPAGETAAEAQAEYLAWHAGERHGPALAAVRAAYPSGAPLTRDQAESLARRVAGPPDDEPSIPSRADPLATLVDTLTDDYPWERDEAARFILTGEAPKAPPLTATIHGGRGPAGDSLRVTFRLDLRTPAPLLAAWLRSIQRETLGTQNAPLTKRSAALFLFVVRCWREDQRHGRRRRTQRRSRRSGTG